MKQHMEKRRIEKEHEMMEKRKVTPSIKLNSNYLNFISPSRI